VFSKVIHAAAPTIAAYSARLRVLAFMVLAVDHRATWFWFGKDRPYSAN
jgi:hypothetical protein